MSAIGWVLVAIAGLFLFVLLMILLMLFVRTGVELVGATGEIMAELRYGFVRIPVWPLPKRKEKAKKEAEEPPDTSKKSSNEPVRRHFLDWKAVDIGETIDLVLTLLDEMAGTLRISRLRVSVRIGTDDAATTGILLGQSAAITGMVVPFFENTFEMKDYHIDVDADFDADHTEWAFTVFCSLRPIRLVCVLLRHGKELRRLYKQLIKKEEAIRNE